VNVPHRGMAAVDRMSGEVIGELDTSARRQEAAIIKAFEQRSMASPCVAAVVVPGPSHETCLPRRPPCLWLRPPRESVVNALLPWHAHTSNRLNSAHGRRRGERPRSFDRDRPIRAQAIVVRDGPPQGSGSYAEILMIQAHNLPLPSRFITRVRRTDVPWRPSAGNWGTSPSSFPGTAIRF
jgi:hypothetical protein